MRNCSYIIKDGFVSAVINMMPYNIDEDHLHYNEIIAALKRDDAARALELIDLVRPVQEYTGMDGDIEFRGSRLFYQGEELSGTLIDQILLMMEAGEEITPLINFLVNLKQNPSYRAVTELYGWMEACDITNITPDGCFLAYKKVRPNYTDIYTGKFNNSIGQVCEMPRNSVDDEANRTCSAGLHFCSYNYLSYFGSMNYTDAKVVVVKINPRDVVSIPTDYNNAKGRTCRYEVVGEVKDWIDTPSLTKLVNRDFEEDEAANCTLNCDGCRFYFKDWLGSLCRHPQNPSKELEDCPLDNLEEPSDFESPKWNDFDEVFDSLSLSQLVEIYNEVSDWPRAIEKFTDRDIAYKRFKRDVDEKEFLDFVRIQGILNP